jgi:hypothetical protein
MLQAPFLGVILGISFLGLGGALGEAVQLQYSHVVAKRHRLTAVKSVPFYISTCFQSHEDEAKLSRSQSLSRSAHFCYVQYIRAL